MRLPEPLARPVVWLELFVLGNLAFLALDVFLAHSVNEFAHPAEWIPVGLSLVGPVLLAASHLGGGLRGRGRSLGLAVGAACLGVGIAGMVWHLESGFFARRTLESLVYAAPFVAPLAYAGLGFLAILSRMEDPDGEPWASWVVFFALGGFVGNYVLSLADHAQNGFFVATEWVSVVAAAVGVAVLAAVLVAGRSPRFVRLALAVMALEVLVGLLGAHLHVAATLERPGGTLFEQVVYGAPPFAPLLFADVALLGALGLWALRREQARGSAAARPGPRSPRRGAAP